ncbi:MAG: MerC domain-containing protein [Blastopirellula sp. JB062]
MFKSHWQDYAGIVASIACAIHCAAMPLVIGFLPLLGLSFLADESFHRWMAGVCFLFAVAAFVPGWRKHRRWMPGMIAIGGLAVITGAAYGLTGECCETAASCCAETTEVAAAEKVAPCCAHHAPEDRAPEENLTVAAEKVAPCCASQALEGKSAAEYDAIVQAFAKPASPTSLGDFMLHYAALWTPLGGLMLVSGHLLNRHYAFKCSCCHDEEPLGDETETPNVQVSNDESPLA